VRDSPTRGPGAGGPGCLPPPFPPPPPPPPQRNANPLHLGGANDERTNQQHTNQQHTNQQHTNQQRTHQQRTHQQRTHQQRTHQQRTHQQRTHQQHTHQQRSHPPAHGPATRELTRASRAQDTYSAARRGAIDAELASQSWCALSDPICGAIGPRQVGTGGQVYFIFPLEDNIWTPQDLDPSNNFPKNLYLDFLVNVRGADGKRAMTRVQTSTEISELAISRQCEEQQVSSSISDIVEVDLFLGLTASAAAFEDSLVQGLDITRHPARAAMRRDVSSQAANVLTMVVKGEASAFTPSFASQYALEVEDMFSMHFLDAEKKAIVDTMIANDLAFSMQPVPGRAGTMRLVPSAMLLQICPIHATRNQFGCMTRREIQERLYDTVTHSIVEISPDEYGATDAPFNRSSAWLQTLLGESAFVKDLGYRHAKVMAERFQLNRRYRRGFMVSPTIPWRQADMQNEGIASSLDLAQQATTVVMVSLDQNIGEVFAATVQVAISGVALPLSIAEFSSDVRDALVAAIAAAAGTSEEAVSVDDGSVQESGGGGARRRMLTAENAADGGAWVHFNITVGFPLADQAAARARADAFVLALHAGSGDALFRGVVARLQQQQSATQRLLALTALPLDESFAAKARETHVCVDRPGFELDLSELLAPAAPAWASSASALASCSGRRLRHFPGDVMLEYDSHETAVSVRGPQNRDDWALYTTLNEQLGGGARDYAFAADPAHQDLHWLWWDLCGEVPRTGLVDPLKWAAARARFAAECCLCEPTHPVSSGNRKRHVQTYSWPVELARGTDLVSFDLARVWLLNPQLAGFRQPAAPAQFARAGLPPGGWEVLADGRSRPMQCAPGAFLAEVDACAPCALGAFQGAAGALACAACPALTTTAAPGAAGLGACVCIAGYTTIGAGCVPCAAGTFKPGAGNGACAACPAATPVTRGGARSADACQAALSADAGGAGGAREVALFDEALGLLARSGGQARCALVPDARSLACPGRAYPLVFAAHPVRANAACLDAHAARSIPAVRSPLAGGAGACVLQYSMDAQRPALASLTLFPRRGYMGPSPLGWGTRLMARSEWLAGTTVHAAPRLTVPNVDLATRADAAVRMVVLLAPRELDASAQSFEWEWIVCGRKLPGGGAAYAPCAAGPDPDTPGAVNIRNPLVLDARVFTLGGAGCCGDDPTAPASVFERELAWTPTLPAGAGGGGDLWLYVFFMLGDSAACAAHGCDESAVYSSMAAHQRSFELAFSPPQMALLPGTSFSYALPGGGALRAAREAPPRALRLRRALPRRQLAPARTGAGLRKSAATRKLLVAGGAVPVDEGSNFTTAQRTITSLDNNAQVAAALCAGRGHLCAMYSVQAAIRNEDYCLEEAALIAKYATPLAAAVGSMAVLPVRFFNVVGVVRARYASACTAMGAGRRLLAADAQDVIFKSVANDKLHLVLSDAHAEIFKIKTVSLTQPAAGAAPQPVSCLNTDAACIAKITGDTALVRVPPAPAPAPAPAPVAVLDSIVGVRTAAGAAAGAAKADDTSNNDDALVIVVVTVTVVLLLCVVGVVVWHCSRETAAAGAPYAPVCAAPALQPDPSYYNHAPPGPPQYSPYAQPMQAMQAMHPAQYQYMYPR